MMHRRSLLISSVAGMAGAFALPRAAFAAYPDRVIRIVVPFAPGGGTDLISRTLAAGLGQELNATVIVDNRPGASTIIGTEIVAHAAPDGYTLVMATLAHAVNPSMQKKLPFDTLKDFTPVALVGKSNNVLVVRSESSFNSVQEIVAAAKANPGKLTFASQGSGTSAHLAGELFKNVAGIDITHIPYRGAGPALTDVIGGQVDMMFATSAAVTALISGGRLRALGVTAAKGASVLPGVPSLAEFWPDYSVDSWYALFAPARTPPDVIAKLNAAVNKVIVSDFFQSRVKEEGLRATPETPEALDRYVEAEMAKWKKIVVENKIEIQ